MSEFLLLGIILGLSAGLAPGPLLTLVVSETLRHDVKAGTKVALAPVVTDVPIVIATLFIFSKLSDFHAVAGVISLAGGCFILYTGCRSLQNTGASLNVVTSPPRSLAKGVLANTLSPHPYLFWLSVGAPTVTKAMNLNIMAAAAFIMGFYACLLGSKVLVALMVGRSRPFLQGKAYAYTSRVLGLLLCFLALALFRDGLILLGLL
jgi:threonine/homoserine/homoserine lactone efflux protein